MHAPASAMFAGKEEVLKARLNIFLDDRKRCKDAKLKQMKAKQLAEDQASLPAAERKAKPGDEDNPMCLDDNNDEMPQVESKPPAMPLSPVDPRLGDKKSERDPADISQDELLIGALDDA